VLDVLQRCKSSKRAVRLSTCWLFATQTGDGYELRFAMRRLA
jgi:hypothetical protein